MKSQHFYICLGLSATVLMMIPSTDIRCESTPRNYIATERILSAGGTAARTIQYYDDFGRPDVLAAGGLNTTGKYVYSLTEYDALGNVSRTWLPSAGGTSADRIDSDRMASYSNATYSSGSVAFSEMSYDALGRVTFTSTPGKEWRASGRGITESHFTNAANSVRLISLSKKGIPNLSETSYYPSGSLYGSSVTDEDGHRMDVYRDVVGNTVLERRYDGGSTPNDTYYLYEGGLLRAVVPMMCLKMGTYLYAYRYTYDEAGRCTEKYLPGVVYTYYWYDRYGRLAFMQDRRLMEAGQYRFFLYDALGRQVVQGRSSTLIDDDAYEALAVPGSSDRALSGTGYTRTSTTSLTDCTIESLSYYDSYSCLETPLFRSDAAMSVLSSALTSADASRSQSLLTAQVVYDANGTPLFRLYRYDWQGRCTEQRSTWLEGVQLMKQYRYSYTGRVTSETTMLLRACRPLYVVTDSIRYDSRSDLPVAELLSVGDGPYITVSTTTYNNLGLVSSRLGFNGALKEEYTYDVHGYLTCHRTYSPQSPAVYLLDENLYYASGPGSPCYNGNVSAMTECMLTPGYDNCYTGYRYSYDGMDRLLSAMFSRGARLDMPPTVDLSELMEYNVDSTIKKLVRRGKSHTGPRTIDSLSLSYTYGHLDYITERAATNKLTGSFEVPKKGTFQLKYDSSGSLVSDKRRDITDIRYDMSGNPAFVAFGVGHETEYGYTTDGVKLWTVHRTVTGTLSSTFLSNKSNPKPTPEIGNTPSRYSRLTDRVIKSLDVTRYYDAFEFEDAALTEGKFYFGGGYVSFHTDGSTDYSAMVSDYRGSTRLVMAFDGSCSNPTLVQINGYYPSGVLVSDLQTAIQLDESAADIQTRKFTGKELDRMHGLDWHDLGARRYDAAVVTFTQIDPLCEKYYHVSPYAYCAGNPIRYVDPIGLDIWEINNQGKIVNRITDRNQDAFYMVDNNGNRTYSTDADGNKHYNSISFEYGTITDSKKSGAFRSATSFVVNSESSGAELFKFFADNTNIEYGLINTQSNGSTIMTNHKISSVRASATAKCLSDKGQTVTSIIHNHPGNTNPSGFNDDDNSGDKYSANILTNSHGYQVEHYVYQPGTGNLVFYDYNSFKAPMPWMLRFTVSKARKTLVSSIRQYPGVGLPLP